jgi:uncharacterized protein YjbI with pentapeptide repeats
LYKAALDGANLGGADLSWTGLSGADLRDAMLSGPICNTLEESPTRS